MFCHGELEQPASKKIRIHVPETSDISEDLDSELIQTGQRIFTDVDRRKFRYS